MYNDIYFPLALRHTLPAKQRCILFLTRHRGPHHTNHTTAGVVLTARQHSLTLALHLHDQCARIHWLHFILPSNFHHTLPARGTLGGKLKDRSLLKDRAISQMESVGLRSLFRLETRKEMFAGKPWASWGRVAQE